MDEWYSGYCNLVSDVPAQCKGLAAAAANLANTAYTIGDNVINFSGGMGWRFVDEVHIDRTGGYLVDNEVDGRAVVYRHDRLKILAVAFRGTDGRENWYTNLNAAPTKCELEANGLCGWIHTGFNNLLWPQVNGSEPANRR